MAARRRMRASSARRDVAALEREIDFLRAEVGRLRDMVALLQSESATHIRRFGEQQYDLDQLKKTTGAVPRGDGSAE
jgi:cell division protein FtsB